MQMMCREILQEGTEYVVPPDGAVCHLHVADDPHKFFSNQNVTITLGAPNDAEHLAIEEAIMKMRIGEEDRLELRNIESSGGGEAVSSTKAITLQLKEFSGPQPFEMTNEDKWRLARWHKERGVSLFSEGKLELGFRQFSVALKYVISLAHNVCKSEHNKPEMNIDELRMTLYLNLSACQLKVRNYRFAAENASKALAISPNNPKGLYRRGAALLHLQEYEKSLADLNAAREIEPRNVHILECLRELQQRMNALNVKYANAMKKMFQ